jgi:hypothetical protein
MGSPERKTPQPRLPPPSPDVRNAYEVEKKTEKVQNKLQGKGQTLREDTS